jgi:hypothetical protein
MFQLQQPSAERDSLAETFAGCSQGVIKVRLSACATLPMASSVAGSKTRIDLPEVLPRYFPSMCSNTSEYVTIFSVVESNACQLASTRWVWNWSKSSVQVEVQRQRGRRPHIRVCWGKANSVRWPQRLHYRKCR